MTVTIDQYLKLCNILNDMAIVSKSIVTDELTEQMRTVLADIHKNNE